MVLLRRAWWCAWAYPGLWSPCKQFGYANGACPNCGWRHIGHQRMHTALGAVTDAKGCRMPGRVLDKMHKQTHRPFGVTYAFCWAGAEHGGAVERVIAHGSEGVQVKITVHNGRGCRCPGGCGRTNHHHHIIGMLDVLRASLRT